MPCCGCECTCANFCAGLYHVCCLKWCPYGFGKTLALTPFWPLVGMLLMVASGIFILVGVDQIVESSGISIDEGLKTYSWCSIAAIAFFDGLVTYSVFTNKLRIHNIEGCITGREECSGFTKNAETCCAKLAGYLCKAYNIIFLCLAWFTTILSIVLGVIVVLFGGLCMTIYFLCSLDEATIDILLQKLNELDNSVDQSAPFLSSIITVDGNQTNSSIVCENDSNLFTGSLFMIISAPFLILAQVVVLVSYNVVMEVLQRHLKNKFRMEQEDTGLVIGDQDDMSRQRIANSKKCDRSGGGIPMRGLGGAASGSGGSQYPEFDSARGRNHPSFSETV